MKKEVKIITNVHISSKYFSSVTKTLYVPSQNSNIWRFSLFLCREGTLIWENETEEEKQVVFKGHINEYSRGKLTKWNIQNRRKKFGQKTAGAEEFYNIQMYYGRDWYFPSAQCASGHKTVLSQQSYVHIFFSFFPCFLYWQVF